MTTRNLFVSIAASASLLVMVGGLGCSSVSDPGSSGFAAVTIQDRSAEEIAVATAQVFGADGYRGGVSGPMKMTFEKPASKMTSLAREGLVSSFYGGQTVNRVKVEIVPLSGGTAYRLEGKAFMVTGGSDPFFQEEVALSHARRGPYQSLLDKVARQLK